MIGNMVDNHVELDGAGYFEEEEMCDREETQIFFGGLFRREESERLKFLDNFSKCSKAWVAKPDDLCAQSMLRAHLPTALRLSLTAPFTDVREHLNKLLQEIQVSRRGVWWGCGGNGACMLVVDCVCIWE